MKTTLEQERLDSVVRKLRREGFRLTPQRFAILRALVGSEAHPSAEDLYTQLQDDYPTMSLATVYKTLDTLKSVGEVLELEFSPGGSRYDGRCPEPHVHLVCSRCGRIEDVMMDPVTPAAREAVRQAGFEAQGYRFDFFGLCQKCGEAPAR